MWFPILLSFYIGILVQGFESKNFEAGRDSIIQKIFLELPKQTFIEYFNKLNQTYKIRDYTQHTRRFHLAINKIDIMNNTRRKNSLGEVFEEDFVKNLPKNFDPRDGTRWPLCGSLINETFDQGDCASCWAVATARTVTDRICIHKNQIVHLTPQDFQCSVSYPKGVCDGGSPTAAISYWIEEGIVTEDCRPYDIEELKQKICVKTCVSKEEYITDKHHGKDIYRVINNNDQIKAELYKNGPISATFQTDSDIFMYKEGIYQHIFGNITDKWHTVKVIGYGEEDGVKYWLAANSWGPDWGEKGFMRIKRGDTVGFEDNLVTGVPA